jgi:quercetin dioxygenase-like cupin family protein
MSTIATLLEQVPPFLPEDVEVLVLEIDLAPGDPGSPPHRHSGPVFGYVVEGELLFRLEDEDERVVRAGEGFWEPGGDVIHYKAANNRPDRPTRFVAIIVGERGRAAMTFPTPAELAAREASRAARSSSDPSRR